MKHKLFTKLRRYRASHGFGIHSPFAYDFVINTLRERLPYYVYDTIQPQQPLARQSLCLLVRILSRLQPVNVRALGPGFGEIDALVGKVLGATDCNHEVDFVYCTGAECEPSVCLECLQRGGTVMIADCTCTPVSVVDMLRDNGMSFTNGRCLVVVGRRDLPRQHFKINF